MLSDVFVSYDLTREKYLVIMLDLVPLRFHFSFLCLKSSMELGCRLKTPASGLLYLICDSIWQYHNIVKRDGFLLLDNFQLVVAESLAKFWILCTNLIHPLLAKCLQNAICCETQLADGSVLHEKGPVVDDRSSEKTFNNKLLAFKLCINFYNATLEEV